MIFLYSSWASPGVFFTKCPLKEDNSSLDSSVYFSLHDFLCGKSNIQPFKSRKKWTHCEEGRTLVTLAGVDVFFIVNFNEILDAAESLDGLDACNWLWWNWVLRVVFLEKTLSSDTSFFVLRCAHLREGAAFLPCFEVVKLNRFFSCALQKWTKNY